MLSPVVDGAAERIAARQRSTTLTEAGAQRIAKKIENYRGARGYSGIRTCVEPLIVPDELCRDHERRTIFVVRSNIGPLGFPPREGRMSDAHHRRRSRKRAILGCPCVDCGVGTYTIREYYIVKDHVWDAAWLGRRKSWHDYANANALGVEILCIGCLGRRIGRTLSRDDFTDAPINDPDKEGMSDRLRNRLRAAL